MGYIIQYTTIGEKGNLAENSQSLQGMVGED